MSAQTPIDIPSALAAIRGPASAPAMPRADPRIMLLTSPALHRLLPGRLAVAMAEAYGSLLWRIRPAARERTRASMAAIVGATERAHEVEPLARRHLIERQVLKLLFWQPPQMEALMEPESLQRLRGAVASGRGVLLSGCHLGPFFEIVIPPFDGAPRNYRIGGDWFFAPLSADYAGRRLAHWWQKALARKSYMIPAGGCFPVIEALMRDGELVVIFFDIIGSRETTFLGKPVKLASGTARLALSTGALVVPMRTRRVGHRSWLDVATPLDPNDYADVGELHQALATTHSKLIIEQAHTLEDPRRAGAWEAGATAESWIAPQHQV